MDRNVLTEAENVLWPYQRHGEKLFEGNQPVTLGAKETSCCCCFNWLAIKSSLL